MDAKRHNLGYVFLGLPPDEKFLSGVQCYDHLACVWKCFDTCVWKCFDTCSTNVLVRNSTGMKRPKLNKKIWIAWLLLFWVLYCSVRKEKVYLNVIKICWTKILFSITSILFSAYYFLFSIIANLFCFISMLFILPLWYPYLPKTPIASANLRTYV